MNREVMREIWHGKSIGRVLLNQKIKVAGASLSGKGLDLAGGSGSYYRFLPPNLSITKTNYQGDDLDTIVDFNQPLPFEDESFDFVLFFSALYIAEDPENTLREVLRIMKPGGQLLLSTPFIANEMPEPHDYYRFTAEGLERLFRTVGAKEYHIERCGERFTSAVSLLDGVFPRWLRVPACMLGLWLDRCIPKRITDAHPTPIGYFCTVVK
jgi:SAM-dependent methyltransferase